jgi:hypothetical protein
MEWTIGLSLWGLMLTAEKAAEDQEWRLRSSLRFQGSRQSDGQVVSSPALGQWQAGVREGRMWKPPGTIFLCPKVWGGDPGRG